MSTGVYKYIQHFYAELQFKNLIDIYQIMQVWW